MTDTISGVPKDAITVPRALRMTCVECEAIVPFDPEGSTDSGAIYVHEDCGSVVHLDLTYETE